MRQATIIEQLLDNGANPNFQDFAGNTPLIILLNGNDIDHTIIKSLLIHGADISVINKKTGILGRPLALAVEKNNPTLLEMMLTIPKNKPNQAELDYALGCCIDRYDKNIVSLLLHSGANPNCVRSGTTILHDAVKAKNITLVNDILTAGFYPNKLNDYDQTAIHEAIKVNSLECIELFIAHGIPLVYNDKNIENMKNDRKESKQVNEDGEISTDEEVSDEEIDQPIYLASELGRVEIVLRLIDAGCPCDDQVFINLMEANVSDENIQRAKSALKAYQLSITPHNYAHNTSTLFDVSKDDASKTSTPNETKHQNTLNKDH